MKKNSIDINYDNLKRILDSHQQQIDNLGNTCQAIKLTVEERITNEQVSPP